MNLQSVVYCVSLCAAVGLFCHVSAGAGVSELPTAKVFAKILDEGGQPIADASVAFGFMVPLPPGAGAGTNDIVHRGKTDLGGEFSAQGKCLGAVGVGANKNGFYSTSGGLPYLFKESNGGQWQPWNARFDLVLKRIGNPIPLYAKRLERLMVPTTGTPVAFDFSLGDWVAPHGRGVTPDILFELNRDSIDATQKFEASLAITFPQSNDGIQRFVAAPRVGSELRLPRLAPEHGYQSSLRKRIYRQSHGIEKDYREDNNWFFRVRSTQKDGQKEQANFGKIDGDIQFWPNGVLQFTYYFNPTPNDRNLEFDRTKNLFGELPFRQRVSAP